MCTAISVLAGNHYFGRNLDYEHTFGEQVTITPRHYTFTFTDGQKLSQHPAMIGMALPYRNYPLYFDAVNEYGLAAAGLNFPLYASYNPQTPEKTNVASFELIPWLLCQCKTAQEAEKRLTNVNITNESFDALLEPSTLHWIVSDREKTITVEQTKEGLKVYDNPVGVLANSPAFPLQLFQLNNFMSLSCEAPKNTFSKQLDLQVYSRGMGGLGLPGDVSSISRFVRACFNKQNAVFGENETEKVHQFFHLLGSVEQIKGCAKVGEGFEMTNYSCCCNTDTGIYYYKTYYSDTISAVDMHRASLDSAGLIVYELNSKGHLDFQN